jgi:hypothetical protein
MRCNFTVAPALAVWYDTHSPGPAVLWPDGNAETGIMDERQRADAHGALDEDLEIWVSPLRPAAEPSGERPRRFGGRFWYRLVGMVVLGALLLAGIVVWEYPRPPRPQPVPDPLILSPSSGRLPCTIDGAAWSPDSSRIVLVGDLVGASTCLQGQPPGPQSGALAIFDAATGRRISTAALGPAVITKVVPAAMRQDPQTLAGFVVSYGQPLWSPDGRRIAVSFIVNQAIQFGNQSGGNPFGYGLVVVTVATGAVRVLVGPSVVIVPPGTTGMVAVQRWDLALSAGDVVFVPPALTYRWTSEGSLASSDLLPTAPATPPSPTPGGPVGNPIGGSSFTLWQSGSVVYSAANCRPPQGEGPFGPGPVSYSPADYYLMSLDTPAWSPDGRYLLFALSAQGRLPLPPPPPASTPVPQSSPLSCSNEGPPAQWPLERVRDAGLQAALLLVAINTQQSIQFTWRPDGQRLAVQPGEAANGAPALTIYDCSTGRVRAQFSAQDLLSAQIGQPFGVMAWSPDSRRLLLVSPEPYSPVRVLGPRSLGG